MATRARQTVGKRGSCALFNNGLLVLRRSRYGIRAPKEQTPNHNESKERRKEDHGYSKKRAIWCKCGSTALVEKPSRLHSISPRRKGDRTLSRHPAPRQMALHDFLHRNVPGVIVRRVLHAVHDVCTIEELMPSGQDILNGRLDA